MAVVVCSNWFFFDLGSYMLYLVFDTDIQFWVFTEKVKYSYIIYFNDEYDHNYNNII